MLVNFTKMHGLGNDFMVVDTILQSLLIEDLDVKSLANRNTGVGFDQLLVIGPPRDRQSDFEYRIFNADGSEVEQCGNGARCFAKYVKENGLTWKNTILVNTCGGQLKLKCENDGSYTINMGKPQWDPQQIPIEVNADAPLGIDLPVSTLLKNCVSMGNPHCVIQVDDFNDVDIEEIGRSLNQSALFPNGVNVGFMQVHSSREITLRVYERGVGETLACGSGACAAVAVGRRIGMLDITVTVNLRGGPLKIEYPGEDRSIMMNGPARTVFQGQIDI